MSPPRPILLLGAEEQEASAVIATSPVARGSLGDWLMYFVRVGLKFMVEMLSQR